MTVTIPALKINYRLNAALDYNGGIPCLVIHRDFRGVPVQILKNLFLGKFTYWLTLRRFRGVPVKKTPCMYLTPLSIGSGYSVVTGASQIHSGPKFPIPDLFRTIYGTLVRIRTKSGIPDLIGPTEQEFFLLAMR